MGKEKSLPTVINDTVRKIRELVHKIDNTELEELVKKLDAEMVGLFEEYGRVTEQLGREQQLQPGKGLYWRKGDAYCPHCWDGRKTARLMTPRGPESQVTSYLCQECRHVYERDLDGNFRLKTAYVQ